MKTDIINRKDIELLVSTFYEEVKRDQLIGPVFTVAIPINWDRHLPVMFDFWENVLFYTGSYTGNPMFVHQHVHKAFPLKVEFFDRWVALFEEVADRFFEGEKASLAKRRASSIATVMKIKILKITGDTSMSELEQGGA